MPDAGFFVTRMLLLMLLAATSSAGTLETDFSSAVVRDLPIGGRTELRGPGDEPYTLLNNSDQAVKIQFSIVRPFAKGAKRKDDRKTAADNTWISVEPKEIVIEPHGKSKAKLTLAVPNDKRYANGEYELWLLAKAVGGQLGLGLITRIKFNTVERPPNATATPVAPPTEDERKQ